MRLIFLILGLMKKNPKERLGSVDLGGSSELKEHKFFKNTEWKAIENGTYEVPYLPTLKDDYGLNNFPDNLAQDISSHKSESFQMDVINAKNYMFDDFPINAF